LCFDINLVSCFYDFNRQGEKTVNLLFSDLDDFFDDFEVTFVQVVETDDGQLLKAKRVDKPICTCSIPFPLLTIFVVKEQEL
jgi:hypothetical protein